MGDNRKKLYDALSEDYDMGTFEQFCKDIEDDAKRKKLFDATSSDYDYGSYDSFSKQLLNDTEKSELKPVDWSKPEWAEPTMTPNPDILNYETPMTEEAKRKFLRDSRQVARDAEALVDSTIKRYDDTMEFGLKTGKSVKKSALVLNKESLLPEDTYLTPSGERYTDKGLAELSVYEADTLQRRLNDAYKLKKQLDKEALERVRKMDEAQPKVPGILQAFTAAPSSSAGPLMAHTAELSKYESDDEYTQLVAAARKNNATIQILEDKKNGRMNDFWNALGNAVMGGYTFSDGMADIQDARALQEAMKHIEAINAKRKAGEELNRKEASGEKVSDEERSNTKLTREEQVAESVLKSFDTYNQVRGAYEREYGAWSRAGEGLAGSLDFMKDLVLFPGAGKLAKGAASKIGSMGGKYLAKEAGGKMTKELAKTVGRGIMKATGIAVGAHVVGGAAVSNTTGIGHTMAAASGMIAGNVTKDNDGNWKAESGESIMQALLEAERQQMRENGSEMFGEFIPGIGGVVMKGLQKIGLSKLASALTNIGKKDWYQNYEALLKSSGYNGLPGEALEEYEGMLFDAMTGHADETLQGLKDVDTHIDIWLGTAVMSAFMGAIPTTVQGYHTAQYYRYKHNVNKADRAAAQGIGEQWEPLREQIDATSNEDIKGLMLDIMQNPDLTYENKVLLSKYVRNLMKMRGYNIAQVNNAGEQDEETRDVNSSYAEGYNTNEPQDMTDTQNMYEFQRAKMSEHLGVEPDALDDYMGDPINFIKEQRQLGASDEDIHSILDYANAKQAYEGMVQRVRDEIDDVVEQAANMRRMRTNKETGMVQGATLKKSNRRVYVVSGNVVMYDDGGGVDDASSDQSLIVIDAETNKMEMVSPSALSFIETPVDATELQMQEEQVISERIAREAADKMEGKVTAFNEGDTYTIVDEHGQPVQIRLVVNELSGLLDNGDGTVNATVDGRTVIIVPKEQIQQAVDEANKARVASYAATNEAKEVEEKAATPSYDYDYRVSLQADGKNVSGRIAEITADGDIILDELSSPINGKLSPKMTKAELDGMVVSVQDADGNSVWKREESVLKNAESVPENAENVQNSPNSVPKNEDNASKENRSIIFDKDGKPDLVASGPSNSLAYLRDLLGDEKRLEKKVEATRDYYQKEVDKAQKALGKAQEAYDNAPFGLEEKETKILDKTKVSYDTMKRESDFWNELYSLLLNSRIVQGEQTDIKRAEDAWSDASKEIMQMGEPVNGEELVAMMLANGQIRLLREDYLRETGYSNDEASKMFPLFRTKENGGLSIEQAGEAIMLADNENGTHFFDENDPNAGRNAILDVLAAVHTPKDLTNYIKNNREQLAKKEQEAELAYYEEQINREYHMSLADYEAYIERLSAENPFADINEDELYSIFAEAAQEYENHLKTTKYEQGTTNQAIKGSNNVLPEEQADDSFGTEESKRDREVEGTGSGIAGQNAAAQGEKREAVKKVATEPVVKGGTIFKNNEAGGDAVAVVIGSEINDGERRYMVSFAPDKESAEAKLFFGDKWLSESELLQKLNDGRFTSLETEAKPKSVQTKIEAAESETNTDPTEAQKKAGNYKMGHVQIGNFDISIENPAGSERKGVDANGKPWSTKMANTYGYMRGTEGVDGDHIDVFLANDMDAWNGRKVFVVDQYNEDGTFDEHKVMLGFNEQDDAESAYFANYEKDWGKKHKTVVTPVNLEDFEKWVDSSHRKTKAFAEYQVARKDSKLKWSNERALNGEPFLIGENGSIDLLVLPDEILERMGIGKIPFRLTPSMVEHVYKRHHDELKLHSKEDAIKAILNVMTNFDHVRKGDRGNTFVFSIEGDRTKSARRAITFVLEYDKGQWIGIKTVGYERVSDIKKMTILWEKGEKTSATGVATANVTSEQPLQSDQAGGIASNQSVVISDNKDTKSVFEKQGVDEQSSETNITIAPRMDGYTIEARKDTRDNSDLYAVKFDERVSRDEFKGQKEIAKKFGGYWSNFGKKGFLFKSEEAAHDFAETVMGRTVEEVEDEAPVTIAEISAANTQAPEVPTAVQSHQEPQQQTTSNGVMIGSSYEFDSKAKEDKNIGKMDSSAQKAADSVKAFVSDLINTLGITSGPKYEVSVVPTGTYITASIPVNTFSHKKNSLELSVILRPEGFGFDSNGMPKRTSDNLKLESVSVRSKSGIGDGDSIKYPNTISSDELAKKLESEYSWMIKDAREQAERQKSKKQVEHPEDPYHTDAERAHYEELKKRMRAKLNQLNSGIDPELLEIGVEMAFFHFKGGMRHFAGFCKTMIEDCGDKIRPHLKMLYNAAAGTEDFIERGWDEEMDDRKTVRDFDVYNFDKSTVDIIETAQHVVKEAESMQQGEQIVEQIKNERNEEKRSERKQEEADTAAIASEAETVASEAEATASSAAVAATESGPIEEHFGFKIGDTVLYTPFGKRVAEKATIYRFDKYSGKPVLDTGLAPVMYELVEWSQIAPIEPKESKKVDTTPLEEATKKVDEQLEKVNKQLALLGYYEAEAVEKDYNEAYGYMRNAEKKAVKDAKSLFDKLVKDLGLEDIVASKKSANKGKKGSSQFVYPNIAPAGGDIYMNIPLKDDAKLSVYFNLDVVDGDNLQLSGVMYRIEQGGKSRSNNFINSDATYNEMLRAFRYVSKKWLPLEDFVSMAGRMAQEADSKKEVKNKKGKITQQAVIGDLFGDLNTNDESKNNEQEVQLQPGSSATKREGGHQPGQNEPVGKSKQHEAERTNGQGMGGRDSSHPVSDEKRSRSVPDTHKSERSVESKPKNTRNNVAERGHDYAPKGERARIEANIKAIETMNRLLEDGQPATREDMELLRRFSGWGGHGGAFKERIGDRWSAENPINKKLREIMTPEQYEWASGSASASQYFTPAFTIDAMWDIARAMGFKGGNVLEGSAGIGNILGLMPQNLSAKSNIMAVEKDDAVGQMLSLLYPDAKVEVKGFEEAKIENGSVDLAITNVPFVTGLKVFDTSGDNDLSRKFRDIHNFCIAKNIRKLREGGIGIFISSSGTMDRSPKLMNWITNEGKSDVVGAFRLHSNTFGGTNATSDIIVVRKRVNGRKSANAIDVSKSGVLRVVPYTPYDARSNAKPKDMALDMNQYFIDHPENMGGEMAFAFEKGETYQETSRRLYPSTDIDQEQRLSSWANTFKSMNWEALAKPVTNQEDTSVVYEDLGEGVKEGTMLLDKNGELCLAQRGKAVPIGVNKNKVKGKTKAECFNDYKSIKDALAKVLDYQTNHEDDNGLAPLLKELNRVYDNFVKTYGHLNKNVSISFLKQDMDFPGIAALENVTEKGRKDGKKEISYSKTDVFQHRVVEKESAPKPQNVKDGIIASIYLHGRVDVPYISEQLGLDQDKVREDIIESGLGFENPTTMDIEVSYEYLSGNVREKLNQAREANTDGRYDVNIKALEAVVPMNIPAHLIQFSLGSSWVIPKLYTDYIQERTDLNVSLTNAGGTWAMKKPYSVNNEKNKALGVHSEICNKIVYGHELIEAALQNRTISVTKTIKHYNGEIETIVDKDATMACANKIDEIRQDFRDWARQKMQSDTELSQEIERVYNEQFNNFVPKEIHDEFIPEHFGGAASIVNGNRFSLRKHQAKAAIRATTQPLMLAHEVGTGKTFTLITTAMEMRRLGTARKPMIVVQNATVGQFVGSAKSLYPNARILTLEDADRTAEGRKNFYAKIRYNDWDMIVVPQSVFERIPDSPEREARFIQDKIEEKMRVIEQLRDASDERDPIVRRAEKELENLKDELNNVRLKLSSPKESGEKDSKDKKREAKAKQNAAVKAQEMLDRETDDTMNFDDMGIDALLIDEAHEYKHLGFETAMQRGVKGVDPSYSKKSQGVYLKTQAILENNNGRNVVFATGTPISNTAAEIWTFMRYLMPEDVMKSYDIFYFDDFVRNFGQIEQTPEFGASGKYKEVNRFNGYTNLPELERIWLGVADTVLTKQAGGVSDKIPSMEGNKAQDVYLPQTKALRSVMKYVKKQLEAFEQMSGKEKKEHSHIPLVMYGIAKAAAVDARLVLNDAADEVNSKTNETVRQTLKSLEESKDYNGTVAVFADNYQNKKSGFNLYEDVRDKLIDKGVPAEQIVIMRSGMSIKKKLEIFDKVNRGEVRVIMGSTFTLGTGVNIQERLHTLIHVDAPVRPMDYTQRNGRILRQGNLHKEWEIPVRVLRFGVEDSLDVTAYQRLKTKGAIADSIMNGKQLIADSMNNRVLEEEQDVFGDITAQLSGSEFALLKNQIEKQVKKLESRRSQWEQDQMYIHNQKPRLKGQMLSAQERKSKAESYLKKVEGITDKVIHVGKLQFKNIDAMADYIKDYNSKQREVQEKIRSGRDDRATSKLTVTIAGFEFTIDSETTKEVKQSVSGMVSSASTKMRYTCEELGLVDIPVDGQKLKNAINDILDDVLSGNDFREIIETSLTAIQRYEEGIKQLEAREGKPFEDAEALEQAKAKLEEYDELMKKELEEKEAKYAEMDGEVEEASELSSVEEEDEDENLYREVTDDSELAWLENQPTVKAYRAMQVIDGRLYSPMASGKKKNLGAGYGLNKWDVATEMAFNVTDEMLAEVEKLNNSNEKGYVNVIPGVLRFEKASKTGKASLKYHLVTDETDVWAAYNPYNHNSDSMLNDQFKAAYRRGNIVVVEAEVPVEDLESGYQAPYSKDAVGKTEWKSGDVAAQFPDEMKRTVYLSRYTKPVRILSNTEVAKWIGERLRKAEQITGEPITLYEASFHPEVKRLLEADGFTFVPVEQPKGKVSKVLEGHQDYMSDDKIAAINEALSNQDSWLQRGGDGSFSDEELSYENDPIAKWLGESKRSKQQKKAYAEKARTRMANRVNELAELLHLDNVEVVTDVSTLEGKKARAKGWFSKSTGKIVVVIPNHKNLADVEQTVLHEAVAHYGLRKLFGKHFDDFLMNVYENASEDVRRKIAELAAKRGWDFGKATEEYLASLAENTNFENAIHEGWFSKIKTFFMRMLAKAGVKLGVELGDNELRYILWRSYENLAEPGRYRNVIDQAADIAKQYELGVGNYANSSSTTPHVADEVLLREDDVDVYAKAYVDELKRLTKNSPAVHMLHSEEDIIKLPYDGYTKRALRKSLGNLNCDGVYDDDVKAVFLFPTHMSSLREFYLSLWHETAHYASRNIPLSEAEKEACLDYLKWHYDEIYNKIVKNYPPYKRNEEAVAFLYEEYVKKYGAEKLLSITFAGDRDICNVFSKIVNCLKNGSGERNLLRREHTGGTEHIGGADSIREGSGIGRRENGILYEDDRRRDSRIEGDDSQETSEVEGNAGKEDSSNEQAEDVLFRDGDPEVHERTFARRRYEERVKTGMYQMQEALQDSMLGLKEAMKAILGKHTKIEDVDGYENAYLGENRLSSVNQAEADAFARLKFKPLIDEIAKLVPDEEHMYELTDYMMAKHGLERNEVMARRAAAKGAMKEFGAELRKAQRAANKNPLDHDAADALEDIKLLMQEREEELYFENREKDFAGLTALTGEDNVVDAEYVASTLVNDYEATHNTDELWKKINDISHSILQKSYECGLIDRATFNDVSSMYKHYIPLRGFDEKTSSEAYAYLTHKESAFNAPIVKAMGRKSKADNPLAYLQSMAESTIMQGNRNKLVKQRFLNFALNHPSDLVSVSELWLKHNEITDDWEPVFPDNIEAKDSAEEVEGKMKDFEERMMQLAEDHPEDYKKGKDAVGIPYRVVTDRDLHQHQVVVKRNGRDYVITINGSPRAAQALNGQTNPDNDMSGAIGAILRAGENVNRHLSAFYTTRNPDFVASNFLRDMLYTNSMVWVKEGKNYALRFHRNYAMFNPVKMKRLLAKYRKDELNMADKTESLFHQFMKNGGETGYVNIRDIEKHKKDVMQELRKSKGKLPLKKAWDLLSERFDEVNRAVENCARFAAFVTSREMDRSVERSIYDAKEVSVNFNKKGSGSKFYDAVGQTRLGNAAALTGGLGRTGFVFWNAAIQGLANFGRQFNDHPKKAYTGVASMFILGAIMAQLGLDDDDEEDKKNSYYNLPEHVRRSNILFKAGDSWVSIPLPVEYRAVYGLGELMMSTIGGKEHLTGGETAMQIAAQLSQVMPLDLMNDGGLMGLVPSAVKPFAEVYENKSWTGLPIYKDTPYNKDMPEWTKAYSNANKYIVGLSAAMNEASGGDKYTKGAIDWNPSKVEYLLNGYFGGVFNTVNRMAKMAETVAGARDFDPQSFLILNRVVKAGDERTEHRAINNEFFRLQEKLENVGKRLRHYENDTKNGVFDYAEKIDFLYNSPEYAQYEIYRYHRKYINELYDVLKNVVDEQERKSLEEELFLAKQQMIEEVNQINSRK